MSSGRRDPGERKSASKKGSAEKKDTARRFARLARSHRGLERLYEVSKLLTRSQPVEGMVSDVVAVLARTLPLRSAIFIQEMEGEPRTMVWQAEGESPKKLREAKDYAQGAYGYLVRSGVDFPRGETGSRELPRTEGHEEPAPKDRFVILPLVVEGPIFGALQVEDARELDEQDLIFVNAVVNQLSVPIDRHVVISAQQASAAAREREQRLLAQASAAVSESLQLRESLAALVRFVVPQLADVCFVDELLADGAVRRVEVLFADEEKQRELAEPLRQLASSAERMGPTRRVLLAGAPLLFSDVDDPRADGLSPDEEHARVMRAVGVRSMLTVPLSAHGELLGALSLLANGSGRRYTEADLALVEQIGYRAAVALEHARLYEATRRAVRGREDLLAIVSHDLKNPLGVIRLHLQMLLRAREVASDRRASRKPLETMLRSAEQMHRLVNDLLTAASVEAGHLSVLPRPLDPAPLVTSVLEALAPLAESKSLRLVSETPGDLPSVLADGPRIQQVLANLLNNSIKFAPEGGTITVRALALRKEVVLSVADTGPGVPPADMPHLFDRFWQAKSTARLGSGLGLFIVKGVVDAHGGRVWAESEPGQGTTVFFTLPRAASGMSTREAPPGPS